MESYPRGCWVELVDGRTACYGRQRFSNKIRMHEVSVNGGGIAVVGDNEIKNVNVNRPGWIDEETYKTRQEQRATV